MRFLPWYCFKPINYIYNVFINFDFFCYSHFGADSVGGIYSIHLCFWLIPTCYLYHRWSGSTRLWGIGRRRYPYHRWSPAKLVLFCHVFGVFFLIFVIVIAWWFWPLDVCQRVDHVSIEWKDKGYIPRYKTIGVPESMTEIRRFEPTDYSLRRRRRRY